ncbi:hypothetical protein EW093_13530 [Thiospirochaeta perfilievii]|uniref:Glycosyltransferase RgtA/B/C/D-like domain-containing protein n=1 Tax=Thiospirochaeta perfilievii TaxID=252967 RepID=A0A5C1QE84_9SPIO|nr:hypothetical protein [Thiospirochaeta perfilievii]QEN05688.1 hypothetical protein EW093_13530 [Thiospirochaeta perfilievii]
MLGKKRVSFYIPYLFIAALYWIFHLKYMPEYLDDAWTLSWAYRLMKFNDVTDYVFGYVNTRGSILFGRGYAYFYGIILELIGWSRSNAVIISTSLTWLTAFIWFKITVNLGYSKKMAKIVSILFLIMEIYFALGNKLRSDSLALCIISFAFYLFIKKHYFFAGLLSIIAFEVHVISLTYFLYILAYLISIFKDMRDRPLFYVKGAIVFLLGVSVGLVYYFFLQREYLEYFFSQTTSEMVGHTFYSYFWKMKFAWRHLPELVIVLVSLIIFFKKKLYKIDSFILPFFICTILSTFIFRRGNYHYTAFVYPSVLLLIAFIVTNIKQEKIFWILLLCYLIPQYGFLYYTNHSFSQKEYEASLQSSIPKDGRFILGNPGAWFALKDREFHEYGYFKRGNREVYEVPNELYLISTKDYRDNIMDQKEWNDTFMKDYLEEKVDSFSTFDGNIVDILLLKKRK